MKHIYFLMCGITLLMNIDKIAAQCPEPTTNFMACNYTAIGHRGYPSVFPENTLLGLEELFKRGVKYAEVDISLTKDSVYVLFHDFPSVYRLTNGFGNLSDWTLAELQQLDFGSWKGEQFKNLKITTLLDAIKIAEKYDAYLYLDTKNYDAKSLKASLAAAGAAPNRIMPSLTYMYEVLQFRSILPNTPWVWYDGGNYPADVNDDNFYQRFKDLGCYAFELNSAFVGDSLWETFKTKVNNHGMKTWVFTVNDNAELKRLVKLGVNGIETDRAWESARFICNGVKGNPFENQTIGNYIFDGNLNASHIGSQIRLLNLKDSPTTKSPEFALCSAWGIPFVGGQDKIVMKVPAFDSTNGLLVYNNSRDELYGIQDNTYTVIMDILIPNASMGRFIALLQTSTENLNDADIFINNEESIGITDEYHGFVTPNTWNRIAIVVDGAHKIIKKYINGTYVGKNDITSPRWAIWNSSKPADKQGFLLFSDNDGETEEIFVSALQLRNYVVSDSSIARLGGPKKNGIKMSNANIWDVNLSNAISDSTILDFENKTYYFVMPKNSSNHNAKLSFKLADNAVSNIDLSQNIKLYTPFEFAVTSEDGSTKVKWKICTRKAGSEIKPKKSTS